MSKPRRPAGLKRSATLWDEVAGSGTYTLRPDELRLLEDVCRQADLVDKLERAIKDAPLTVKGSMGQMVAHPVLQEIRQHRATLHRLTAQLKLPDAPAGKQGTRGSNSDRARAVANARWSRQKAG
ncbi:MAG: P27 family phage terminase small subunit [Actinomycetota bacterium]